MKLRTAFSGLFKSKPRWYSPDLKKKVLILEGGGMRGVFLTGVLQAFVDRDYFPWEMIIGSSAGALNGSVYASDQIYLARDAFFTNLPTAEFISFANLMNREKHVLNIDWVIDTILNGHDPLDVKKLKRSCPVLITATDCSENQPLKTVYLNSKKDDIYMALKATSAVPYLYRGFVEYKGYMFLDGALLDPIPFKKALKLGYKDEDILVVVSRHKGYRKKQESFWVKNLYEHYYKDEKYHFLVEALDNRYLNYNKALDDLYEKHPNISVIYPPENFKLSRITRDREKLIQGFEFGIAAGKEWLGIKPA